MRTGTPPLARYGRLLLVKKLMIKRPCETTRRSAWECLCDCGNTKTVLENSLKMGGTGSCGCIKRENLAAIGRSSRIHGGAINGVLTPEYKTWSSMRERCYRKNHKSFDSYGGRGIKICKRWESFILFLKDMGPRPSLSHTIDRVKNNLGYFPSNCRWATKSEQSNNRRACVYISFAGKRRTLSEWAREIGIKQATMYARYNKKMPLEIMLNPSRVSRITGRSVCVVFRGEKKNIAEWSKSIGIKASVLYTRIQKGWSVEKTFTSPVGRWASVQ